MGELTEIKVAMNAEAWRKTAETARTKAVEILAGGDSKDRLFAAAQLLDAQKTFLGHANMMELSGDDPDTAVIDAWDLADEGYPGLVVPA